MNINIILQRKKSLLIAIIVLLIIIPFCLNDNIEIVKAELPPGDIGITGFTWVSKTQSSATIKWAPPQKNGDKVEKYFIKVYKKNAPGEQLISESVKVEQFTIDLTSFEQGQEYTVKIEPSFLSKADTANSDYGVSHDFFNEFNRPKIDASLSGIKLNEKDYQYGEDLTNVPTNVSVVVRVKDDYSLTLTGSSYLIVKDNKGNQMDGTITTETVAEKSGTEVNLIFVPKNNIWDNGKTYIVSTNDTLKDNAGNLVFPISFQFTTLNENLVNETKTVKNEKSGNMNPHGSLTSDKNSCFNCHGTPKKQALTEGSTVEALATQYCLTCHDGTIATAVIGASSHFTHGGQTQMGTTQCSDCHDSHLGWSISNPNALKTRLVYDHMKGSTPLNDANKVPVGTKDSTITSCYSCHFMNTGVVKQLATTQTLNGKVNEYYQADALRPYNYKKMATSTGQKDDMSMCFSCHNENDGKATNIEQYYMSSPQLDTESGHKIVFGDRGDGTMEGYLACSDCHETHGSDNMYLLKTTLGHQNPTPLSITTKFETGNYANDRKTQKVFCISCHNGNTELYGKMPKTFSNQIIGHRDSDPGLCSDCHGGSFIKAAHSPTKLTNQ